MVNLLTYTIRNQNNTGMCGDNSLICKRLHDYA